MDRNLLAEFVRDFEPLFLFTKYFSRDENVVQWIRERPVYGMWFERVCNTLEEMYRTHSVMLSTMLTTTSWMAVRDILCAAVLIKDHTDTAYDVQTSNEALVYLITVDIIRPREIALFGTDRYRILDGIVDSIIVNELDKHRAPSICPNLFSTMWRVVSGSGRHHHDQNDDLEKIARRVPSDARAYYVLRVSRINNDEEESDFARCSHYHINLERYTLKEVRKGTYVWDRKNYRKVADVKRTIKSDRGELEWRIPYYGIVDKMTQWALGLSQSARSRIEDTDAMRKEVASVQKDEQGIVAAFETVFNQMLLFAGIVERAYKHTIGSVRYVQNARMPWFPTFDLFVTNQEQHTFQRPERNTLETDHMMVSKTRLRSGYLEKNSVTCWAYASRKVGKKRDREDEDATINALVALSKRQKRSEEDNDDDDTATSLPMIVHEVALPDASSEEREMRRVQLFGVWFSEMSFIVSAIRMKQAIPMKEIGTPGAVYMRYQMDVWNGRKDQSPAFDQIKMLIQFGISDKVVNMQLLVDATPSISYRFWVQHVKTRERLATTEEATDFVYELFYALVSMLDTRAAVRLEHEFWSEEEEDETPNDRSSYYQRLTLNPMYIAPELGCTVNPIVITLDDDEDEQDEDCESLTIDTCSESSREVPVRYEEPPNAQHSLTSSSSSSAIAVHS